MSRNLAPETSLQSEPGMNVQVIWKCWKICYFEAKCATEKLCVSSASTSADALPPLQTGKIIWLPLLPQQE